jgi:DnaK suppressor protein
MNDIRDAELKRLLEARRQELQRNLVVKLADVRGTNGCDRSCPDTLDGAEACESDLQQDVNISLTEITAQALRRVDEALARLASGAYGLCRECNAEIPTKRLTALPFAVRCRECEELREIGARQSRRFSTERTGSLPRWDAD